MRPNPLSNRQWLASTFLFSLLAGAGLAPVIASLASLASVAHAADAPAAEAPDPAAPGGEPVGATEEPVGAAHDADWPHDGDAWAEPQAE